jgi:hypothetical protein
MYSIDIFFLLVLPEIQNLNVEYTDKLHSWTA